MNRSDARAGLRNGEPVAGPRLGLGSVVCGLVLTLGHLATCYPLVLAYLVETEPWDTEASVHSGFASGLALAFAVVTGLLTWVCVKAEWLRRWWYVVPAALAVAALLRLTLLAPDL